MPNKAFACCLKVLPDVLEGSGGKVTAVTIDDRLIAVEPEDTTGEILGTASATNTQNIFEADVISSDDESFVLRGNA